MIFDKSSQPLKDMQAESQKLNQDIEQLTQTLERLKQSQTQMVANMQQHTKGYKDLSAGIAATETSLKKANDQISANSKLIGMSKGSLQQNRELLALLNTQYDSLAASQGKNSKQVKELNTQIAFLSQTVANQDKKLQKSRELFDFQKKSVDALKGSIDQVKSSNAAFGPVLDDAAKGFNAMKSGLDHVKTGFQTVGGAIKTTGFGALVLVLQSLVSYFTETKEGSAMLSGAIAGLKLVIDSVKKVFVTFGETIVNAVKHPAETMDKIWNAVVENLKNRLSGFKVFFEGLMDLDFKKMGDGLIQVTTGIKDGTNKLAAFGKQIKQTYEQAHDAALTEKKTNEENTKTLTAGLKKQGETYKKVAKDITDSTEKIKEAEQERLDSIARLTEAVLAGYEKEIFAAESYFNRLIDKYKDSKETIEQLEREKAFTLNEITRKFQEDDLKTLTGYQAELLKISNNAGKTAKELALQQVKDEYKAKEDAIKKIDEESRNRINKLKEKRGLQDLTKGESDLLDKQIAQEDKILGSIPGLQKDLNQQKQTDLAQTGLQEDINADTQGGHETDALQKQIQLLDMQHNLVINATQRTEEEKLRIESEYKQKRADLEDQLVQSKIHAGDKYIDAVLKFTKKDSAIFKAAFIAKKATAVADVIISTKKSIIASFEGYAGLPFIGQALAIAQGAFIAAQGAASIAQIVKQKPGFAAGGHFVSDGRGALLGGYSRTDDTNAYLRSGEAVVVSEAMRNPWARNLVSAINVAHGGRDFSTPATTGAFALGGVFTDGGNAGRYYTQPVNDVKELANTLAYQMINNFPPVYVDVKDINTQQSILARTVDRVNL